MKPLQRTKPVPKTEGELRDMYLAGARQGINREQMDDIIDQAFDGEWWGNGTYLVIAKRDPIHIVTLSIRREDREAEPFP